MSSNHVVNIPKKNDNENNNHISIENFKSSTSSNNISIKISGNDKKEVILGNVKIVDSKNKDKIKEKEKEKDKDKQIFIPKESPEINKKEAIKQVYFKQESEGISDKDKETIEKHKLLISMYDSCKEIDIEENTESTDINSDYKNCDVLALTRELNVIEVI